MDETTSAFPAARSTHPGSEPAVASELDGDTARVTLTGELTDAARRPLVRVLTQLLLDCPTLHRVELLLRDVTFMNSAGMAVLVQGQRMAAPRGIELVLLDPPAVVVRPLQLTGLWHRFPVVRTEEPGGADS